MSRVLKSAKWTTFATVFNVSITMLQLSILARVFDSAIFGQYAILNVAIEIFSAVSLGGISTYLIFKRDISAKGYNTVYFIALGTGIVSMCIMYLISPHLLSLFGYEHLSNLLQVLCVLLVINSISAQYESLAIRDFKHNIVAIIDITSRSVGFLVAMLTIEMELLCLVFSAMSHSVTRMFLLAVTAHSKERLTLELSLSDAKLIYNYGIYNIGSQFLNITRRQIDTIILAATIGASELGIYHVVKQLAARPGQALQPIVRKLTLPLFSENQDEPAHLRMTYIHTLRVLCFILASLYAPLVIFSEELIQFLLGPIYSEHYWVLTILGVFWFVRIAAPTAMGILIQSTGNTKIGFIWNVFTLPLSIVFMLIAARFGIYGLCLGLLLLQLILLPLSTKFVVKKVIDVNYLDIATPVILLFSLLAIPLLLVKFVPLPEYMYNYSIAPLALYGLIHLVLLFCLYKKVSYIRSSIDTLKKA
jgi:O-antigen/teichoic acid export membrane protein